ncbi:YihY/virulence factor BrkB family protein [Lipingzhangella sp. LS1_29]|uniref:YihY/virulence factor BrkB family protein n=2 Tax=Lipingzhangella rawalii TaxID=2055835 RepID=A0ABU2H3F0_9ACTN|nr:YihY/virulence factor BrkB family protein [Lipingzhangella rawalii]
MTDRFRHYGYLATESYWKLRRTRPSVDHVARAVDRYSQCRGSQLAAAVTYFAFLSLFPVLALAFALVGYATVVYPEARTALQQAIEGALPGFAADAAVDSVAEARTGAGLFGLLGLLYAGLGVISALREALRTIWLKGPDERPNVVVAKLLDLLVLGVLGLALLSSVALTSFAQAATHWLLTQAGLSGTAVQTLLLRLLGLGITIAFSTLIFLVVFQRLSGTRRPWRMLWRGALLAAVGFEMLKSLGALLVSGTMGNPVYASFAVTVGLLVWINIVARYLMFTAAWTATWLPMPTVHGPVEPHSETAEGSLANSAGETGETEEGPAVQPRRGWVRRAGAALIAAGAVSYAVWARRRRTRVRASVD